MNLLMYSQELVNTIIHLLDRAEKGLLEREELFRLWPTGEKYPDAFIEQVWDDLEDAVDHLPVSFLTGEVNMSRWRQTDDYRCIVADRRVLTMVDAKSSAVLLERRRRLLSATP